MSSSAGRGIETSTAVGRDDAAVVEWYEARAATFDTKATRARRHTELLGVVRLTVFLVAVACAAWFFSLPAHAVLASLALIASVALFLCFVALHARARRASARARALRDLNLRGVARVRRDWASLPEAREEAPPNHAYAADLDVAGMHASLYRLLDVVSSSTGRPVLMHWLLDPPPNVSTITERQAAVAELADATTFREELALLSREGRDVAPEQLERFLRWAEDETWLAHAPLVVWAARVVPVITIVTVVFAFLRWLPWTAPALSVAAGLFLLGRYRSRVDAGIKDVLAHASGLRPQRQMLEHVAATSLQSALLRELRERTAGGAEALRSLERTLWRVEGRGSLIHAIVNPIVLLDVHALAWLDRWREHSGRSLRDRLAALGTVEALGALGMLAHDNPAWRFPTFEVNADCLTAQTLGHPLLPRATRVGNDVTVGPAGTMLLVTGSNMSGKSTLLRAIGLNVVLAQAGAPVCADRLTMPLVELRTSIRLADSLERGVSLFMAELERLKEIVDAARADGRRHPLLYLLDEILHGTNTAERLIAARAVLGHLVRAGAIGAVTTHDLNLAADGALAAASRAVHFSEHVTQGNGDRAAAMTFDYRLRPGLATSTNALKLLALVGLAEEHDLGR